MKKIIVMIFLPLLFFYGCAKEDGTIVDPVTNGANSRVAVVSVDSPDTLTYSVVTTFTAIIILSHPEEIKSVTATLNDFRDNIPLATVALSQSAQFNDTTAEYSASFGIDTTFTSGVYSIDFAVTLISGLSEKLAVKYIYIKRIYENSPPVLSNLVIPDTVAFNEKFTFHVDVYDINGASDVREVYYKLYKPDGALIVNSQGISEFPLSDSGDTSESGDVTAGDGIYTMQLLIPTGQPAGVWRMDFQAIDYHDSLSNIISHNLTVQ